MFRSSRRTEWALRVGALGHAAYLSDLSKPVLSVWPFIGVVMVPVVIRLSVPLEEYPTAWGRRLHVLAASWYLTLTLLVGMAFGAGYRPPGWPFFVALILCGSVPCVRVLAASLGATGDDGLEGSPTVEDGRDPRAGELATSPEVEASAAAGTPQVLRPNRWKTLGWLALTAGFAAGGAWMIESGESSGWFVASFFGLGAAAFAVILLPGSAYLRVDADGFTICSLYRARSYRWSEVGRFGVGRVGGNRMVVFDFSEEYRACERARRVAAALTGHEGALPDSYGLSLEGLAELLNRYRDRAAAV